MISLRDICERTRAAGVSFEFSWRQKNTEANLNLSGVDDALRDALGLIDRSSDGSLEERQLDRLGERVRERQLRPERGKNVRVSPAHAKRRSRGRLTCRKSPS